jgi:hypothetical protein
VTGLFGGLTRVRGAAAFLPVLGAVSAAVLYGTVGRRRRKAPLLGAIRLASSPDEDSTQTELPSTSDLSGEELS